MFIALAFFAFLLGSIPFGVIICRAKGVDIFSVGSGNIGATNVVRAVGPAFGMLVFALDVAKGYVPGLMARLLIHDSPFGIDAQAWSFIFGSVAIVGHVFSPWISFRGGKGIATGLGALLASIPVTGLLALAVMILITAISRYVSLGSIVAALSTIPISLLIVKDSPQVIPILVLANFVVISKHRANISRIINGTENKFRFKSNEIPPEQKTDEKTGDECKKLDDEPKNEELMDQDRRP